MSFQKWIRPLAAIMLALALLTGCAEQPAPQPAEAPTQTAQQPTAEPGPTPEPAAGYVRVTAGNDYRWFALPEDEEYSITVKQPDTEGNEYVNVIHFTLDGVYMESSTCDNQDCVKQGLVTLENKDLRVLTNWIICLPNRVSIELYTPEELLAMNAAQQEQ